RYKAASFSPFHVRFFKIGQSISCRGLENVRFSSQGAWSDGAIGRPLRGWADLFSAGGRFLPRRYFARRDGSQQLAQVAGALGSEHGFKSRLRLGPAFERRLQALLARLGQAQLLGTAIGCSRLDADQPVPLQRQDVAS